MKAVWVFVVCFVLVALIDDTVTYGVHPWGERAQEILISDADPVPDDRVVIKAVEIPEERVTYEGAQVWRVSTAPEKTDYVSYLQEKGDISTWVGNETSVDVMVRPDVIPRVKRFLQDRQINFDVVIPDLQKAIEVENPTPSPEEVEELVGRNARYLWWRKVIPVRKKYPLRFRPLLRYPVVNPVKGVGNLWNYKGHRMEWTSYHRLADILEYLDYLAETFPDVCSVMTIGNSIEGRPLKVLRISNGTPNAPALWIDGGIHAREWISPAVVTYIIDYLVEHSDELQADYYILPVLNPDGYEYTFRGDRLWRKNRSSPEKGGVCIGADLNRNFGYRWGGLGASKQPCSEIFAGTAPFSEPETRALKNFFEASAANFQAYLSFHSYGQYILYPWGYDRRVPPDYPDLDSVGRSAAAAMKAAGGVGSIYTVGNSAALLYPAAGGSDDWAKGSLRIKYSYIIELRDRGTFGFILPARYIISTAKEALAMVQVVTVACRTS